MTDTPNLPEIPWVGEISRMDDDDLKARLSGLPARVQIDVVTSLGWDDRLKVIRNSDAAGEIVQGLPDEEGGLAGRERENVDRLGDREALDLAGDIARLQRGDPGVLVNGSHFHGFSW